MRDDCRHPRRHAVMFAAGSALHRLADALVWTAKRLRERAAVIDCRLYDEDRDAPAAPYDAN